MKPLFCSQGHDNLPGSRFCQFCGEPLQPLLVGSIGVGTIVGDRYRLVRELGHGGFGRTYLAEDINRFNELCVLKEFAPKVQGTYAQQKAEELFAREAGVLYQLQHPQIPKFRELCRSPIAGKSRLFLVQDFVEGQTYRALLFQRRREGKLFSEAEAMQLLRQLLPVLDYIHARGVIHRDISPDNLILRSCDRLPVLIDFGGVKKMAADVESQVMSPPIVGASIPLATRLGKVGYAPEEQMTVGRVYPHSDLYALAATAIALLTGQEPQQQFDPSTLTWRWDRHSSIRPALQQILMKMLARQESDRFQSAAEVLQALDDLTRLETNGTSSISSVTTPLQSGPISGSVSTTVFPTQLPPEISPPPLPALSPSPVAPNPITANPSLTSPPGKAIRRWEVLRNVGLVLALAIGAGTVGWWGGKQWVKSNPSSLVPAKKPDLFAPVDPDLVNFSSRYSPEELKRKQALRDRRKQLGIDYQFFVDLVNETFYDRYPTQRGLVLTYDPSDAEWRSRWDAIAAELLEQLSTLSEESRKQLGHYDVQVRSRAQTVANRLNLSSRALYDLTDAHFFHLFPEQKGMDFIDRAIGQVWQGVLVDELNALQHGDTLERINFSHGAFRQQVRATLAPGDGKAYTAYFSQGQILRLSLQTNDSSLLSIYTPNGNTLPLLEDSSEQSWSGILSESGYYEIVVVSNATQPISYYLYLAADNITSE